MSTNTATTIIVGIDEAGRGPIAGPVVAAACHIPRTRTSNPNIELIHDSKKLTPEQREKAYTWITQNCPYGIGIIEAKEIDEIRILSATEKAMNEAIENLIRNFYQTPSLQLSPKGREGSSFYLLVDGRDKFWFDHPHSSVIKGDEKEPCISAASILAKVTRDRIMCETAKKFPYYGFEQHKGYGTEEHMRAIEEHGLCSIHRKTFIRM
jgi:ribonuclease HII